MSKPKILLVGEGNFSYAASQVTDASHTVVATALLGDKLLTDEQRQNIQLIEDNGGQVLLDVDATLLSEHAAITSMQFQRIQFNFPHVGGKMNIEANRTLLRNFFESCRKLVDMGCLNQLDGQVWVTLCAGQGGTPADTKEREWHNTWQVVPQAESAQFGLIDVKPFTSSEIKGYNCTGYRGQDKGFKVVEALVHVFEYDPAFRCPALQEPMFPLVQDIQTEGHWFWDHPALNWPALQETSFPLTRGVRIQDHVFQVPCFFADLIERNLLEEEDSPVRRVLNSAQTVLADFEEFSYIRNEKCILEASEIVLNSNRRLVCVNRQADDKKYVLLPSVLTLDAESLLRKQCVYTVGRTFLQTRPGRTSFPVQHQIWLSWTEGSTFCPVKFIQMLLPNFDIHTENCESKFNRLVVLDMYNDYFSFVNDKITEAFEDEAVEVARSGILCDWESKYTRDSEWVATVFKLVGKSDVVYHLCLSLDHVAMMRFGIDDWRVFWCKTSNYYEENELLSHKIVPHDLKVEQVFRPKNLFPTMYIHDVSFWLPEDKYFDGKEMELMIRSALSLALHHGRLLEEYFCPRYERQSLCYRIVYQSREGSLSKEHCNLLQHTVRNLLRNKLDVILR